MATHSLRHRKRKGREVQLQPAKYFFFRKNIVYEVVTWGIEFIMLVSTLFWAIEANANSLLWQPSWFQVFDLRAPAALKTTKPYKGQLPHFWQSYQSDSSKGLKSVLTAHSKHLLAPQTAFVGDALSPTFKRNPYYVPTSLTLLRFRTF